MKLSYEPNLGLFRCEDGFSGKGCLVWAPGVREAIEMATPHLLSITAVTLLFTADETAFVLTGVW